MCLTKEVAEQLWKWGVLSDDNLRQLLNTVFLTFNDWGNFALRSGEEHWQHRVGKRSHFSVKEDPRNKRWYVLYNKDT